MMVKIERFKYTCLYFPEIGDLHMVIQSDLGYMLQDAIKGELADVCHDFDLRAMSDQVGEISVHGDIYRVHLNGMHDGTLVVSLYKDALYLDLHYNIERHTAKIIRGKAKSALDALVDFSEPRTITEVVQGYAANSGLDATGALEAQKMVERWFYWLANDLYSSVATHPDVVAQRLYQHVAGVRHPPTATQA